MHFTQLNDGTGGKAGKFAVVAGLHVLVGMGMINVMNSKSITLPKLIEDATVWIQPQTPPPPPPEPPQPVVKAVKPPPIVVPKPEVEVPLPPVEEPIQASTEPEPLVEPAQPVANDVPPTPAAKPGSTPGQMGSAVLANAEGCAKPDYPINAARNGDTGTVTLALLVGADGRVQDARVQRTSGHRELDRAALNALSLCQFKPAMNNGVAQPGWGQIAYVWTLE
ncbi:energy transducer TonB [Massilia sp. UBA6681]|uniref:energy transducer TonB n=1 Tax=Massilia sp. UBA6681 TaxID=1946839 RepID=UPI0025C71EAD|nr:energy transducer TonB [Massilia sp. UBA6681]